jgi:hypothetical protein
VQFKPDDCVTKVEKRDTVYVSYKAIHKDQVVEEHTAGNRFDSFEIGAHEKKEKVAGQCVFYHRCAKVTDVPFLAKVCTMAFSACALGTSLGMFIALFNKGACYCLVNLERWTCHRCWVTMSQTSGQMQNEGM